MHAINSARLAPPAAPPVPVTGLRITGVSLVTMLVLLWLTGCNNGSETSPVPPGQAALNDARAKWTSANITDYTYIYNRVCFCAPEEDIVVTVVNHVVDSAFYTPSGVTVSADSLASLYTIDDLFNLIQDSINAQVATLDVAYNPTFGYPESIFIDGSLGIADDEIAHGVSDFQ